MTNPRGSKSAANDHIHGAWETGVVEEEVMRMAGTASQLLEAYLEHDTGAPMRLRPERNGVVSGHPAVIPYAAACLVQRMLSAMSHGSALYLFPVEAELTTQEAADILHVSRPHIIQLMEEGTLVYRHVGKHRRVTLRTLLRYQNERQDAYFDDLLRRSNRTSNSKPLSPDEIFTEAESLLSTPSTPKPAPPSTPKPSSSPAPSNSATSPTASTPPQPSS